MIPSLQTLGPLAQHQIEVSLSLMMAPALSVRWGKKLQSYKPLYKQTALQFAWNLRNCTLKSNNNYYEKIIYCYTVHNDTHLKHCL